LNWSTLVELVILCSFRVFGEIFRCGLFTPSRPLLGGIPYQGEKEKVNFQIEVGWRPGQPWGELDLLALIEEGMKEDGGELHEEWVRGDQARPSLGRGGSKPTTTIKSRQ
jgi:hypothetical protein